MHPFQIPILEDTIVVRDGPGSMTCDYSDNLVTPLEVATGLALYCAERLTGSFQDKFITFSARPKRIDVSEYQSRKDKLITIYTQDECSNTNIRSVFNLILKTAIEDSIPKERMP